VLFAFIVVHVDGARPTGVVALERPARPLLI
jgi:hypothetical protein